MKAGELFVEIGFKGAKEAVENLNNIKKGIGQIATEALGAFGQVSGLVGAFLGLATISGNAGQKLVQYSNLTGQGISKLQDWQYALGNAGVSIEETTQSLLALQQAFSPSNLMKTGLPPWLGQLGQYARVTSEELSKAIQNPDPTVLMEVFRKAAQNAKTPGDRQNVGTWLRAEGLSNNVIQGLFSPAAANTPQASKAFKRTLETAQALAKMRVEITRLGQELERKFDSFLLKNFNGIDKALQSLISNLPAILTGLTPVIEAAASLAKSFLDFSKNHPAIVKAITEITAAVFALGTALKILTPVLTAAKFVLSLFGVGGTGEAAAGAGAGLSGILTPLAALFASFEAGKHLPDIMGKFDDFTDMLSDFFSGKNGNTPAGGNIPVPAGYSTINVNQHITAPNPVEAGKHAAGGVHDVLKKHINNAYRSNPRLNEHS